MSTPRQVVLQTSNANAEKYVSAVLTNADFFATEVRRTSNAPARPVKHMIYINMSVAGVLEVYMNNDDPVQNDIKQVLNAGVALIADGLYYFELIIGPGQTYNLRHQAGVSSNVTVMIFETDEIGIA